MRFLALFVALFSSTALADQQQYPFKLLYQRNTGGYSILAQNGGPAAIQVTVDLRNSVNVEADHPSPIVAVTRPHETVPVAKVHAADGSRPFKLAVSFKFSIGDPQAVPDPSAVYRLPFREGQALELRQVFGGRITTHTGLDSKYAVDFGVPVGTPVTATRQGVVVDIDKKYTAGGNAPHLKANHVLLMHEDGTLSLYSHLSHDKVVVSMGQKVEAGELLGYSGNTGYSSGPHLHFSVLTNTRTPDGVAKYRSLPVRFEGDTPGGAITLAQGQRLVVHHAGKQPARVSAAAQ